MVAMTIFTTLEIAAMRWQRSRVHQQPAYTIHYSSVGLSVMGGEGGQSKMHSQSRRPLDDTLKFGEPSAVWTLRISW